MANIGTIDAGPGKAGEYVGTLRWTEDTKFMELPAWEGKLQKQTPPPLTTVGWEPFIDWCVCERVGGVASVMNPMAARSMVSFSVILLYDVHNALRFQVQQCKLDGVYMPFTMTLSHSNLFVFASSTCHQGVCATYQSQYTHS